MFKQFERSLTFKINAFCKWLESVEEWIGQRYCDHIFRPAKEGNNLGQVCKYCTKFEYLTKEQFFAYYGECGGFNA